jgi:hypothetical protein
MFESGALTLSLLLAIAPLNEDFRLYPLDAILAKDVVTGVFLGTAGAPIVISKGGISSLPAIIDGPDETIFNGLVIGDSIGFIIGDESGVDDQTIFENLVFMFI